MRVTMRDVRRAYCAADFAVLRMLRLTYSGHEAVVELVDVSGR